MDFMLFRSAVAKRFEMLSKHNMFRVELDKDALWKCYLESFPPGTNEIYKTRREYDCVCCRQFIRAVGNVVAIVDGKVRSIWEVETGAEAFDLVANSLVEFVLGHELDVPFLSTEKYAGTDKNLSQALDGSAISWRHFFVTIPARNVTSVNLIGPELSRLRAAHDVLHRTMETVSIDAVETILELISQNSLYRGEEHRFAVKEVLKLQKEYLLTPTIKRDAFIWDKAVKIPGAVSGFRNTAIGTLAVDLSEGMDLENAVNKFEAMVAPSNYKRTSALVTPAMVAKAKEKIEELGITSALERRFATIEDVNVTNLLFANRNVKTLKGDVFDQLAAAAPVQHKILDRVEQVPIERFIKDILPKVESVEIMFDRSHVDRLVSLIAPVDPTAARLFKWDNPFSWSYNGDVADSLKERVKKAGGDVSGQLCCRLAWYSPDDLDLHMKEPSGTEIYYGNFRGLRGQVSPCGGVLDLDMNGIDKKSDTEPVENIVYKTTRQMKEGVYRLFVHCYHKNPYTRNEGFDAEIEYKGDLFQFPYPSKVRHDQKITIAEFKYSRADGIEFLTSLAGNSNQAGKQVWGMTTGTFQPVSAIMLSPNFWSDHGTGNRHYFFMLENCANDSQARGFYNEFLRPELDEHRKVLEMVGSKLKTEATDRQLSGLGFSSTQHTSVLCRVKGSFTRTIKLVF